MGCSFVVVVVLLLLLRVVVVLVVVVVVFADNYVDLRVCCCRCVAVDVGFCLDL